MLLVGCLVKGRCAKRLTINFFSARRRDVSRSLSHAAGLLLTVPVMSKTIMNLLFLALIALAAFWFIGHVSDTAGIHHSSVARSIANVDHTAWVIPALTGFIAGFLWRTLLWDLPVKALGWAGEHRKEFGYLLLLLGIAGWVVYF